MVSLLGVEEETVDAAAHLAAEIWPSLTPDVVREWILTLGSAGPSGTPSRWAPSITTSSSLPVRVSASTFQVGRCSTSCSRSRVTVAPPARVWASRSAPSSRVTPTVPTTSPGSAPRVPFSAPSALL